MAGVTDPARELAVVCDRLKQPVNRRGDDWLAENFKVPKWSLEFHQIVFCIIERCDFVVRLIPALNYDDDLKQEAIQHIEQLKTAFNGDSMVQRWDHYGANHVNAANIQPLKMLSAPVRERVSYPQLDDTEVMELVAIVDEMLEVLSAHQMVEQDFIRQALIDGVLGFKFRLERLQWLGWGYTMESLREILGAYYALERGIDPSGGTPQAEAILKKFGALLQKVYETTVKAKEATETAVWTLALYSTATGYTHSIGHQIAGLLPAS